MTGGYLIILLSCLMGFLWRGWNHRGVYQFSLLISFLFFFLTWLQITRCKVAPSITTGQSIKWHESNQRPGRAPGQPDSFHGSNFQKAHLCFFKICRFSTKLKFSFFFIWIIWTSSVVVIVNFANMGPVPYIVINIKIRMSFPCIFSPCSVFSWRKPHKDSSCQAANLYSCEGHVRQHGTRHKSEFSLVISHLHCALMSIGGRSGMVCACEENKISEYKRGKM